MLVLSRKTGQEIHIGDNIRIVINRIGGHRVTVGIEAPRDVRIVRGELKRFVEEFQEQAHEEQAQVPEEESPAEPVPIEPVPVESAPVARPGVTIDISDPSVSYELRRAR